MNTIEDLMNAILKVHTAIGPWDDEVKDDTSHKKVTSERDMLPPILYNLELIKKPHGNVYKKPDGNVYWVE